MGAKFDGNRRLVTGNCPDGAIVTNYPLFVFSYFKADVLHDGVILCVNQCQGFVDVGHWTCETIASGNIKAFQTGGSDALAGPYTPDVWYTAAWLFRDADFRKVWLGVGVSGEDTTHIAGPPPVGETEVGMRVLIFGTGFRGFSGCMEHLAAWNTVPEDSTINALLSRSILPLSLPTGRVLYLPQLISSAVSTMPNEDGDPYIVQDFFGDPKTINPCEDSPDIPTCASAIIAEDCTGSVGYCCAPFSEPVCDGEWPFDELQPKNIGIFPVKATLGGGPALFGKNEEVEGTSNGFWRFRLGNIPIRSNAQVRRWHQLASILEGKAGVIRVHIFDGKRAPWATVGDTIVASAGSLFLANGSSGSIKVTSGGVPVPGMHFSAADRLYRLRSVGLPTGSPPVYPVTVWPKIRTTIAPDDPLEFSRPVCRVRLKDSDGMSIELELLRYAEPTVEFEEDI